MEKHLKAGMRSLDLGTGTGILAIAAAKMGTSYSLGVDIDELSMENGLENVERNNVQGKVEIRIGSLDVVPEHNFDIILANIIRNTIIELMPEIVQRVIPNGILLFSGLLTSDEYSISSSLQNYNCTILEVLSENEWIGIAVKKN
jgi:ribosomal protein L11 methyltransferase